jgi:hypothetical protein
LAKLAPEAVVELGSELKDELAAMAPTVYAMTREPDAPVFPREPPEPLPLALSVHCAVCAPQLAPVVLTFEKVALPKALFQTEEAAPPPLPDVAESLPLVAPSAPPPPPKRPPPPPPPAA